jgi:hypothetical protein
VILINGVQNTSCVTLINGGETPVILINGVQNTSCVTLINGGETPVILINDGGGRKRQLCNPNQRWQNTGYTH